MRLKEVSHKGVSLIDTTSVKISNSYAEMLAGAKKEFSVKIEEVVGTIDKTGFDILTEFKEALKVSQLSSQQILQKRINDGFDRAQEEINAYKREKFRLIEENADKIMLKLSEDVLGKVVSLEDHEKLIFEALNKIKEEGVFNK